MSINGVLLDLSAIENIIASGETLKNEDNVRFSEKIYRVRGKIEDAHQELTRLLVVIDQTEKNQTIPDCRESIKDLIKMLEKPLKPITVKD